MELTQGHNDAGRTLIVVVGFVSLLTGLLQLIDWKYLWRKNQDICNMCVFWFFINMHVSCSRAVSRMLDSESQQSRPAAECDL